MSARPISGKLYIGAITSPTGATGTLIDNVEAREYTFRINQRVKLLRTGPSPDQVKGYYTGAPMTVFVIRPRDTGSDTLALLFEELETSGGLKGDGTGVTSAMAAATTTAMIVRPNQSGQNALYIPNAVIAGANEVSLLFSERGLLLQGNELVLRPTRAADNTEPAWAFESAANLITLYAGLS